MTTQTAAQAQAVQAQKNRDFMRLGYSQPILANAQTGNAYVPGTLLNYDIPVVAGAYAEKVRIYYTINFTYTPGTGGATVNAGGAFNLFSDLSVLFGNKQITTHPYILKVLGQMRGYNRTNFGQTLGSQSASVQGLLYSMPALTPGANVWKGYYDLPLTLIHPTSPFGLLPIGGTGTKAQIQLTAASGFTGPDPLLNVIAISGNATVTAVTGTVGVNVFYRDYKSFATPVALECDLSNLPTAQIIKLREVNPLTSGSMNYASINNPYPFSKIISIICDGNSSGTFTAATNLQGFRIDSAENTSSALRSYEVSNGGMNNYFTRQREIYGCDFDDGVTVFDANAENTADASLQEGEMWLNVSSSGFPAARLGFQVGSVSSALFTPRVVSYGVMLNPIGIQ